MKACQCANCRSTRAWVRWRGFCLFRKSQKIGIDCDRCRSGRNLGRLQRTRMVRKWAIRKVTACEENKRALRTTLRHLHGCKKK